MRVPTTATIGFVFAGSNAPSIYRSAGGKGISRSWFGYVASSLVMGVMWSFSSCFCICSRDMSLRLFFTTRSNSGSSHTFASSRADARHAVSYDPKWVYKLASRLGLNSAMQFNACAKIASVCMRGTINLLLFFYNSSEKLTNRRMM